MNDRRNMVNIFAPLSLILVLFVAVMWPWSNIAAQDMPATCVAIKSSCGEADGALRPLDEDPMPTPTPTPTEGSQGGGAGGHTGGSVINGDSDGALRLLDEDPMPTPTPTPTENPNGGGAGGHTGG